MLEYLFLRWLRLWLWEWLFICTPQQVRNGSRIFDKSVFFTAFSLPKEVWGLTFSVWLTAITENMTADKIADFIDQLSLCICKDTFVVLDNASVHRCKFMKELRPVWEKWGLSLFFFPPYSPHLNLAEILWWILGGKWLRSADYFSTDSLLYATNRALAAIGDELNINFAHVT